jgi:phenylacetate-CoA ligase
LALSPYYDALETRSGEEREAALMSALPRHLAHAKSNAPGWARILKEVEAAAVTTRAALAKLPVTRKSDLGELQKAEPPLGGLNATPVEKLARLFVSPGPVYDPEGQGPDWWRTARSLYAAGFRAGDRVLNGFSYHFTSSTARAPSAAR